MNKGKYKCTRCDSLFDVKDGDFIWCPICGCGGWEQFELDRDDIIKSNKLSFNDGYILAEEMGKIKISAAYINGYQKGYDEGYEQGFDERYIEGYDDAIKEMKVMFDQTM